MLLPPPPLLLLLLLLLMSVVIDFRKAISRMRQTIGRLVEGSLLAA